MIRIIIKRELYEISGTGKKMLHGIKHKTFDIDAPEIELYLQEANHYESREIIGTELVKNNQPQSGGA